MNFNEAKIINVYYTKGDRKPYDINGKPIAYIGEEFVGATGATTLRFHFGEDLDSSTATIVTKRADGERRLDILTKVGTGATSYYEVTLNEWYGAVKGKAVVIFKAYNGSVTFDDNENPTEITSVSGRIVVGDIFNLDIAYAPVADLVVPPDGSEPYQEILLALSTKLDKVDSITVAGALPTLTGDVYDDRYFYIENEGVGRLYYINGSTAEEVVWQVGTLKLTATGNGELTADTGKISFDEGFGGFEYIQYRDVANHIGQDIEYYGKAVGAIVKGEAVQFAGVQGNHYLIKKAVPSEINANPKLMMGIAKQTLTNNEFGYVAHFGRIRGINTSAYAEGAFLWFASGGAVDGALTTTQPTAPNAKVLLAVVVDDANNGTILVRPTIEPKLDELQNVLITSATNGNVLSYDGTKWVNSTRLTTAEGEIDDIEDGTTIVGKANADKDGNEFDAIYLKKTSASSIYIPLTQKGAVNGVATLGGDGRVLTSQLPASIGEILEYADLSAFPEEGTSERIYIALDTNKTYRWSGTQYVEISASLAIGETSSTAFAGNRGVALETLTDDIVDGTQTLTDTRITNSAIGVSPLVVNAIASTSADLQTWEVNSVVRARISSAGTLRTIGTGNLTSVSNSNLSLTDDGAIISRNVNNTNPALIVRKQLGTGNILELQTGTSDKKLEVDVNGWFYQNGTRLFHQTSGGTFFGTESGNLTLTGNTNTSFGFQALQSLTTGVGNTAIGHRSLRLATTGSNNSAFSRESGSSITTGSANTFVGRDSGNNASQLATGSNMTALGYESFTDKSNQMVFGNASVTEFKFNRNASAVALFPQGQFSSGNANLFERTSSNTNTTLGPILIKHTSSGDMADGFGSNLVFQIRDNANTDNTIAFLSGIRSGADNSGRLAFFTATTGTLTEKMTILPNGNVGIGTGSPATPLHITTTISGDQRVLFNSETTTTNPVFTARNNSNLDSSLGIFGSATGNYGVLLQNQAFLYTSSAGLNLSADNANGVIRFGTGINGGIERMLITSAGLVGINETSPSAQLHVKSGATGRVGLIVDSLTGQTANLQEWKLNGTNKAIIDIFGSVLTGAVSNLANSNNALVQVLNEGTTISRNVADSNPALIVNLANASASGNIQVWQKGGVARASITNNGGASFNDLVTFADVGFQIIDPIGNPIYIYDQDFDYMYVEADGDIYNKNGTYGTISDLRLKNNIENARDYTEDLMKLRVVKYSFKKDQETKPTHLGFIAQEVEKVFPNMVETHKTKELDDMKTIKLSVLIPMLVKTIQEQQKQIDELKALINA